MVLKKNVSREYKTLKHNIPPDSKLLFGDDLSNRIKLLQASNKACKVNITPNNSRYYQTFTVPILAETKKIQKASRASREESLQKLPP